MEGGCYCGKVRYSVSGEPILQALCHCLDCRKISGSAYSTNAVFPLDSFKVLSGNTKGFEAKADSGNPITSHFCGDCGSTMWRIGDAFPGKAVIKLGTLDDPKILETLKPQAELFTSHRVSWLPEIPGTAQKKTMS